ncbi:MAG: hypothetical protein ABWZ66_12150 [Pyrinomonadaceae bacterium]
MSLRIKITFATERSLFLQRRAKKRLWCERCNAETDFVTGAEINNPALRLTKNIEDESLHKFDALDGTTFVCLASILDRSE